MVFIDFCKAYDANNRKFMWETLRNQGIHGKMTRALSKFTENHKHTSGWTRQGNPFTINRRVRQGESLSLNLFKAVLEVRSNLSKGDISILQKCSGGERN